MQRDGPHREDDNRSRRGRVVVFLFFLVTLVAGIRVSADYGLSWDEHICRVTGAYSALYVNHRLGYPFLSEEGVRQKVDRLVDRAHNQEEYLGATKLFGYQYQDYGVAFELPLIAAEMVFGLEDARDVFLCRHLLTYLFFWVGMVFFYLLLFERFGRRWPALIGCLFLLLSPRLFAHAFTNTKDMPLLTAMIVAAYSLNRLLKSGSWLSVCAHAFASAFLIGVRIPGIIMPAVTVGVLAVDGLRSQDKAGALRRWGPRCLVYGVLTAGLVVIMWPYLWPNPIGQFAAAFKDMSRVPWYGSVLYLGTFIKAAEIPWHYAAVWLGVTTPPLYLLLFVCGIVVAVRRRLVARAFLYAGEQERLDWIILALFFGPFLSVIVFRSVLYNGWRQLYFTYPAFLYIAVMGLVGMETFVIRRCERLLPALRFVVLACAALALASMIKLHPYQGIYFNGLAGAAPETRFDADYWGVSYRECLEYLVVTDDRETLAVHVPDDPGYHNALLLKPDQRQRLQFVPREAAEYVVTAYIETASRDRHLDALRVDPSWEVFQVTADGMKLASVFKVEKAVQP